MPSAPAKRTLARLSSKPLLSTKIPALSAPSAPVRMASALSVISVNTAAPSKSLWLESSTGVRVPLRGHVSLGRSRTNTIPIVCEKVSRRHALIHQDEEGECLVIDLGSSNGTYVNGVRITHLANLQLGDQVEIGTERFVLRGEITEEEDPEFAEREATAAGAQLVPCWIIIGDKENPDGLIRKADIEESYKTTINWTQVCQHILERNTATIPADLEGKLFAYWRDPLRDPAVAGWVVKALRELRTAQARQRMEFRLALHFGTVVIGSSDPRRKKALIGTEVTFAFHMQRLAWVLAAPCLISEEANRRIAPLLPTTALDPCGLHSYNGDRRFFSL